MQEDYEVGLADRVVYVDANGNGQLDAGEVNATSATSRAKMRMR